MTKKVNLFETAKTLQDVRGILILNLDKLDNKAFIKDFRTAYTALRSKQEGKYGPYTQQAEVDADGYIKIATTIRDLTRIRVGRSKIKLGVAFKLGGVNLSGDTKLIRDILKTMGFRWNPKTLEWYNSFTTMPTIPDIPKSVKAEPVKPKAEKPKKAEPVKTKAPTMEDLAKLIESGNKEDAVKMLTGMLAATQPAVKKTGKPKLAEPRKLEGEEKAKAMAEFKAKAAAKRASRERNARTTLRRA